MATKAKLKTPKQPPAKVWLGKRLENTENDGVWCYVGSIHKPYMQIILNQYKSGDVLRWVAFVRVGNELNVRSRGKKTEGAARAEVERQLLWYHLHVGHMLKRCSRTRSLPPIFGD